jgi:tRNA dimethylallyltransferase
VPAGVLILTGQTAAGKTALALRLAERFDAEIVGADSRQIYRDMPVGTAAPSAAERARVRHHLIGFLDPRERYSAARFVADALAAIDEIHARGGRAIVVGGTGFYVRVLAGDVALSPVYHDELRARLAREARIHEPDVLHEWLAALAPQRASALEPGDRYRITRALEIALTERSAESTHAVLSSPTSRSLRELGIPIRKTYLEVDDATLDANIALRVDAMLATGFLDEAERIGAEAVAADAVGYREALAYLAGWSTAAELRAALVRATRRYAKRQATWFRREPGLERVAAANAFEQLSAIAGSLPGW